MSVIVNATWSNGDNATWSNGDNLAWKIYTSNKTIAVYDINDTRSNKTVETHNVFVSDGWMLYARNASTGVITELGFVESGSTILVASLADGTYDIEARPNGNYWDDCRTAKIMRVVISGGTVAAEAPVPVSNLTAKDLKKYGRDITWTWFDTFGASDPHNFGIWLSDTSPVVTTGEPDYTAVAGSAGLVYLLRYGQTAAKYIAVCARDSSGNKGAVSELYLSYPSGAISGPDIQWGVANE